VIGAGVALLWATEASAAGLGPAVAQPEGWIGTTAQWAQGLGFALALLTLVLLIIGWRGLRRGGNVLAVGSVLFVALALMPVLITFVGYLHGFQAMETVESCGGCHAMTPFVDDLKDPKSEALAAVHYKNRYIQENHCYTCHTDYGMFGTASAKMAGVGHIYYYVTGRYTVPIKIASPYPNARCLGCHGESQKFLTSAGHPKEDQPKLVAGAMSCLDCHGPPHTPKEAK
jgi:nitrate/TMAO reductase-like tetraheme cytochrome c subunit